MPALPDSATGATAVAVAPVPPVLVAATAAAGAASAPPEGAVLPGDGAPAPDLAWGLTPPLRWTGTTPASADGAGAGAAPPATSACPISVPGAAAGAELPTPTPAWNGAMRRSSLSLDPHPAAVALIAKATPHDSRRVWPSVLHTPTHERNGAGDLRETRLTSPPFGDES